MKELSLERMENIEGGGSVWSCIGAGVALGTVFGMGLSAAFGNPFAIAAFATPQGQYAAAQLVSGGLLAAADCLN
jgi:lactobin A/cerein 7B family class IIb bacteriocin